MSRIVVSSFAFTMLLCILVHCSKINKETLFGSGTLEATEVLVRSKSVGDVLAINVEEGDHVLPNQVIAQIDTEKVAIQKLQLKAGLEELELNLKNARRAIDLAKEQNENAIKKHARIKTLFEQQSATEQQLDDVEMALRVTTTRLENARTSFLALQAKRKQVNAQLQLLDSQIQDATIRAPMAGVVIAKYVQQGEMVSAGAPIVNLADLESLWIRIYLTTTEVGRISLGSATKLTMDAFPEKTFSGRVTWISPKAEFTPKNVQTKEARADLVYAVKVEAKNPTGELKIGMPADVYFE
jgi:HlyD family secretion protein